MEISVSEVRTIPKGAFALVFLAALYVAYYFLMPTHSKPRCVGPVEQLFFGNCER